MYNVNVYLWRENKRLNRRRVYEVIFVDLPFKTYLILASLLFFFILIKLTFNYEMLSNLSCLLLS